MKKWEYVVLERYDATCVGLMAELDQYGHSGWELVSVSADDRFTRLYLKREPRE